MQVSTDARALIDELAPEHVRPDAPGGRAWTTFLRAHASLMRQLELELDREARMALADFDVLIQLALGESGRRRMADLAARALISRSGMTRRVERLAEEGLVTRDADPADRRAVIVALTDKGLNRLREALPIHARGIGQHFVAKLDDDELTCLEGALRKVVLECDFG